MGKKMKESGLNHQRKRLYRGNVLLSTLVLFLVCHSLLCLVITTYRLSVDMNQRTKNYYLAKIMKQMFLSECKGLKKSGSFQYTLGKVYYKKVDKQLTIEITIKSHLFKFTEKINNSTDMQ